MGETWQWRTETHRICQQLSKQRKKEILHRRGRALVLLIVSRMIPISPIQQTGSFKFGPSSPRTIVEKK